MGCISLYAIGNLLVWIVIVCAILAIIRILVGTVIPGVPAVIIQILNVILWAVVCIAVIWLVIDLATCVLTVPRLR